MIGSCRHGTLADCKIIEPLHRAGISRCNHLSCLTELTKVADPPIFKVQMKTLVRHLLLLAALLGLLWQGVAYASPPCADMQKEQSAATSAMAGMADCMDGEKQSRENTPPCKDMKAGCFAMVGCASLVGLGTLPMAIDAPVNAASSYGWAASPVLIGRNEAPIPDPPSILG